MYLAEWAHVRQGCISAALLLMINIYVKLTLPSLTSGRDLFLLLDHWDRVVVLYVRVMKSRNTFQAFGCYNDNMYPGICYRFFRDATWSINKLKTSLEQSRLCAKTYFTHTSMV